MRYVAGWGTCAERNVFPLDGLPFISLPTVVSSVSQFQMHSRIYCLSSSLSLFASRVHLSEDAVVAEVTQDRLPHTTLPLSQTECRVLAPRGGVHKEEIDHLLRNAAEAIDTLPSSLNHEQMDEVPDRADFLGRQGI